VLDRDRGLDRGETGAVRAALCGDAQTADWGSALERRQRARAQPGGTSHAELAEILDAWFVGGASKDPADVENIAHLGDIERSG